MTVLHLPQMPRTLTLPRGASVLRLLALVGLFLLPIQMRAGAEYVHPHALIHLLMDAGDHALNHHQPSVPATTDHAHGDHSNHPPRTTHAAPDLPGFESITMAAGGLAVTLAAGVPLLIVSSRGRIWPRRVIWRGTLPVPDPPPPRLSAS